jgi:uncharacterized repeat protein (TIGR01451 family)
VSVAAGGQIAYTIAWSVSGNETAQNVTIDDSTPQNTTFASASGAGTISAPPVGSSGVVRWSLGNRAPGSSGTVILVVNVNNPLPNGTTIDNSASISDGNGAATNTSSASTLVTSGHTLTLSKSDTPDPATPGGLINYTIHWTVTGNEAAQNVVITDGIPANTTFWSCGGCSFLGSYVSWDLGTRNPGSSGDVFLQVRVNTPMVNNTLIANTARISDGNGGAPVSAAATTTVASDHTLTIKKNAPAAVGAGNVIAYSIDYRATGSELALGTVITDVIPANTTFEAGTCQPSAICAISGNLITWTLGDLQPGDQGTVQFTVRTDSLLANGVLITNTARIYDALNKSAESSAVTRIGSAANLVLLSNNASIQPGDLITFTAVFSGVDPLNNGRVQIDLPLNTTFVGASTGYLSTGDAVFWFLSPQPANFFGQRYLVVQALPVLDNGLTITGTAYLSGDGQNSRASRNVTVVSAPKWTTSAKTADRLLVEPTARLTYTIALSNTGNMNAQLATLADTLPAGVTYAGYVSASSGTAFYDAGNNRIIWNGVIGVGSAVRISYAVTVDAGTAPGTTIVNSASVADEINSPSILSTQVNVVSHEPRTYLVYLPIVFRGGGQELPDLTITAIEAVPSTIGVGQTGWDVRITVKNIGTAPLPNGVWVDMYVDPLASRLPIGPNVPFYEISTYGGVWWIPSLNPGESVVLSKSDIMPDWLPFFPDKFNTPGDHTVYAQIDSLDERTTPPPTWVRVYESNENNNVFGPVTVHVTGVTNNSISAAEALPHLPARQEPR